MSPQRKVEEADPAVHDQLDLVRAVVKATLAEARKEARKDVDWSKSYLGDEHHLQIRAAALRLITRYVSICYSDRRMDAWFEESCHIYTPTQWAREIDQHLVRGRPMGADGLKLRSFKVAPGSRATIWLTRADWLHCAVQVAADRDGVEDPARIRDLREGLRATGEACTRCHPQLVPGDVLTVVAHDIGRQDGPEALTHRAAEEEERPVSKKLVSGNPGRDSLASGRPSSSGSRTDREATCATTGGSPGGSLR